VALLVRPVAFLTSLSPSRLDRKSLTLITWFGPRGLSSLLLVLLPVFAGMPGSARLFSICCLVVLLSVLIHGGSLMVLGRLKAPSAPPTAAPAPPDRSLPIAEPAGPAAPEGPIPEQIDIPGMLRLQAAGEPVVVLDARSLRTYEADENTARGSIRLDPERSVQEAERLRLPRDAWLIVFCA
jgi:sodium/hydrogen antiporter